MQISQSAVASSQSTQTAPEPQPSLASTSSDILIGLPATLGFLAFLSWSGIRAYKQYSKKIQRELNLISSVMPCRGCRYFHNNPYLKCTVNPTTALTEDAVGCSDHHPRDRKPKPFSRDKF
jgi:hypothetical protein